MRWTQVCVGLSASRRRKVGDGTGRIHLQGRWGQSFSELRHADS